jgi:hypothetical protein
MKVNAFECPKCAAVIFSRTRHDYRWCPCKTIAVDGGLEYARVVYKDGMPASRLIDVVASKNQLYEDWNNHHDKFGIIVAVQDTINKNHV